MLNFNKYTQGLANITLFPVLSKPHTYASHEHNA